MRSRTRNLSRTDASKKKFNSSGENSSNGSGSGGNGSGGPRRSGSGDTKEKSDAKKLSPITKELISIWQKRA